MPETQSISEKERMDHQLGRDLLSDLPVGIIHIILTLVPFRDTVKTSILSRQWRYTWASLPHLVFEDEYESSDFSMIWTYEKRMFSYITQALFHHKGAIHKFKLSLSFEGRSPNIDNWILCLARKNIKELILDMGLPEYHKSLRVHSSIYFCEKLTKLELGNCKLDPPLPLTFKGFLFLQSLCLRHVCMSSDEIECLVANCPLLEEFDLLDESERSKLRISSPNLKYLDISGDYVELCVSAPLLAEMSIWLYTYNSTTKHQQQKCSVCNYTVFMDGFTNLEKLSGFGCFTKYLSMGIESCHRALVFHQLKDIELFCVDFEEIKAVLVVTRLIVGAPNLEKLEIGIDSFNKGYDESEAPHPSCMDFGCASNCTFEKLRVVNMSSFYGHPLQMEFLKFLLKISLVLETMSVSIISRLTEEQKQNVTDELLGFDRASPNANLSFSLAFA